MVQCCGCQNKGEIQLKATFDKDCATSDDVIQANVSCDLSQCSGGSIKEFRVQVYKNCKLVANGWHPSMRLIRYPIITAKLPGVQSGTTSQDLVAQIDFSKYVDVSLPGKLAVELG